MTVVLIAPPLAKACEPLLGIGTLKAWLEQHGIPCTCIDANAEGQQHLLQTDRLDAAMARVAAATGEARTHPVVRRWRALRPRLPRHLALLRSRAGYEDLGRYRTAVTAVSRALGVAAWGHDAGDGSPIRASLGDYQDARYCTMDSESVVEAARDPARNLFYEYFRDDLVPRVRALRPRVIGLSLIFRNQLLCGAVLARMLAEACPDAHVTLGGELVSAWIGRAGARSRLLELCDSIVGYEGELPLLALARGRPLAEVPNLCYRDEAGRVRVNPNRKVSALAQLPPPDFSWAPWDLYFAPERTAPMVTARGCYWNRCTFCPEVVNPERRLRLAASERVIGDMEALHERHGVTTFHFIDSAMPPRTLRAVADHVSSAQRPWGWYGFSRLEPDLLRDDRAASLGRGGCRMLKLGLETASQRLLDAMDKQQDVGQVSRILRALRDGGVGVHAYLMFGTPLEERADAEATQRFVAEHRDCIQFANVSIMNLAQGSPMALEPSAHGITAVRPFRIEGRTLDLALYDNFDARGWGREAARRFVDRELLRDDRFRAIHLQTPPHFDANHSVFLTRAAGRPRDPIGQSARA